MVPIMVDEISEAAEDISEVAKDVSAVTIDVSEVAGDVFAVKDNVPTPSEQRWFFDIPATGLGELDDIIITVVCSEIAKH